MRITSTDRLISWLILPVIPSWVTPNQVTLLRFFLVPFVVYLLMVEEFRRGAILFGLAALTDALDGAMARYRNQITEWGKIYDPLADKLLVGTAVGVLVTKYVSEYLAAAIIFVEVLLIVNAFYKNQAEGKVIQAVWAGKLKMILQSSAILLLLVSLIFFIPSLIAAVTGLLYLSLLFALISLLVYRSI